MSDRTTAPAWSFAELVAPMDPNQFLAEIYDKKPVHLKGDPDRFRDLLTWTKLNELLALSGLWTADSIDVALEGRPIPPAQYATPGHGWDGRQAMRPNVQKLTELLRRGATIAVEKVHGLTPELRTLSGSIESAVGAPVTSNAFCSWDGVQGYGAHFDTLQVFAIQLEGEKTWQIFDGRFPNAAEIPGYRPNEIPQAEREKQKGKVLMEVTLTPGDMLYVPQGQYHCALASDKSLHLSLGARHYVGADLINLMVPFLAQIPEFRTRMPHFDDEAAHQAHCRKLGEILVKAMQDPQVSPNMRNYQREKAFERHRTFTLPNRQPVQTFRVRWTGRKLQMGGAGLAVAPVDGNGTGKPTPLPAEVTAQVQWMFKRDLFTWTEYRTAFPMEADAALKTKLQTLQKLRLVELV